MRTGPEDKTLPGTVEEELYGSDLGVGAVIGDYVIEDLRSRGGFASVYRAKRASDGRLAAVKVLHYHLASSAVMTERFRQEADTVNRIRHPNIVDILDFGELRDGRPYFAMEWLSGRDLNEELAKRGRFSPAEALHVVERLADGLAAAHRVGVVHRDLKASNVLLVSGEGGPIVKLVDFGIAKLLDSPGVKLTSTGTRLGTPHYMAPEQILGEEVDARTDIYAFGVLLFNMLTGAFPFDSPSPVKIEEMHLRQAPPAPSTRVALSPAIDAVVLRCLHKLSAMRYPSADAVAADFRAAVTG